MIVIPMAGLSSRFFKAGYEQPKYMLEAHGKTLFDHAVLSFSRYFETESFLFIVRDVYETPAFVKERARALGIQDFHIYVLEQETRGQAETVALGLESVTVDGPLTIFNIDTFRPGFVLPEVAEQGFAYLEVFQGSGDNWSFAKPVSEDSTRVSLTTEKNPVSDLCSTGLYHFANAQQFVDTYNAYLARPQSEWEKGELYVAPLYNWLIQRGDPVHYHLIERDEVIFCGVPDEYTEFLARETDA